MRLPKKSFPLFAVLFLLLQGCMSSQRDLARFATPDPAEAPAYKAKAEEFIRYAQTGDVDKMLGITSTHSFATQSDSLHTVYAQQVVPQFAGTVVTWDTRSKGDIDEQNNAGLMFTGTVRGKTTLSFDIAVMKENGKLVIINIRKHHWYQR
jgi:hypothetical protein